ncbi:hypothetical protein MTO96_024216 [Rhipicephalus appendiculatus]
MAGHHAREQVWLHMAATRRHAYSPDTEPQPRINRGGGSSPQVKVPFRGRTTSRAARVRPGTACTRLTGGCPAVGFEPATYRCRAGRPYPLGHGCGECPGFRHCHLTLL